MVQTKRRKKVLAANNCYLGFDRETGTAVVVLSNLPPDYRIPATVLGVKLLTEL